MNYRFKRQAGLTLVELMVATTLSLVLLAGVLLVFTANKTTYRMQNGLGTLQENGRYAISKIAADLRLAGFGGCLSPSTDPRIAMLASNPPPYLTSFADGEFFGGRNNETAVVTFGGVTLYTGLGGAGTDTIEVRGPLRSNVTYVTGELLTTDTVNVEGTNSGFAEDEYLMVADCAGADIFRATGVATGGGNTQVSHDASENTQATLSRRYGADSVVMEFTTHTYFVGLTGRNYVDSAGNVLPLTALYRFDGTNAQELVDGVEDLQIEFALDTDGNGVVDMFADPGGVTDWSEVMSVRISLLMNSVDDASAVAAPYTYFPVSSAQIAPPANDFRLRQEVSSLVSVRNRVL